VIPLELPRPRDPIASSTDSPWGSLALLCPCCPPRVHCIAFECPTGVPGVPARICKFVGFGRRRPYKERRSPATRGCWPAPDRLSPPPLRAHQHQHLINTTESLSYMTRCGSPLPSSSMEHWFFPPLYQCSRTFFISIH